MRKIRKSRETKGLSGGPSNSSSITGARNQLPGLQLGVIWKEPVLPELPQPGHGAKGGLETLPRAPCIIDLRRCPAQCLQWESLFLNIHFTRGYASSQRGAWLPSERQGTSHVSQAVPPSLLPQGSLVPTTKCSPQRKVYYFSIN